LLKANKTGMRPIIKFLLILWGVYFGTFTVGSIALSFARTTTYFDGFSFCYLMVGVFLFFLSLIMYLEE